MNINTVGIAFILSLIRLQRIESTKYDVKEQTSTREKNNPLASLLLNQNGNGNFNHGRDHTNDILSRVKRQYSYDPYGRRSRYPYPLPIFLGGGGIGFGRGFGGQGFGGGRGFGGRGFGGRGIGGRGIGGRGGGGIGGHGGVGGGHGGGGGRG